MEHIKRETAQKRGGGRTRGESAFEAADDESASRPGLDGIPGVLDPESLDRQLEAEFQKFLASIEDPDKLEAALLKMDGCQTQEIAERLSVAPVTVRRWVVLVRDKLAKQLGLGAEDFEET